MNPELCFFDVDETLITVKSMMSFQNFYYQYLKENKFPHEESFSCFEDFKQSFELLSQTLPREEVNKAYYRSFSGRSVELVETVCSLWFDWAQQEYGKSLWHSEGIALLRDYQAQGCRTFLVSGSFKELLAPLAKHLGVTGIIATELIRSGDSYTGDILGSPCIGQGKGQRVKEYCAARDMPLEQCCAAGDHISDAAMLEIVGKAHVIAGDKELMTLAQQRNWSIHGAQHPDHQQTINL